MLAELLADGAQRKERTWKPRLAVARKKLTKGRYLGTRYIV